MHDRAVSQADRIEADTFRKLERLFPAALAPLMRKHKGTLDKLDKLERDGAYGRARVLIRRSGLLVDVARAIASAGKDAADLIRSEILGVKEVAADGPEEAG